MYQQPLKIQGLKRREKDRKGGQRGVTDGLISGEAKSAEYERKNATKRGNRRIQ